MVEIVHLYHQIISTTNNFHRLAIALAFAPPFHNNDNIHRLAFTFLLPFNGFIIILLPALSFQKHKHTHTSITFILFLFCFIVIELTPTTTTSTTRLSQLIITAPHLRLSLFSSAHELGRICQLQCPLSPLLFRTLACLFACSFARSRY